MRSQCALTTALLLFAAATSVYADEFLLWDNYPGDVLQDVTFNMSSERNTQVVESTWVVDDVDMAQVPGRIDPNAITLTRLQWVGARHPDYSYSLADVIVLDSDPNGPGSVAYLGQNLSYSFTDFDPDPNPDPDAQTYTGVLTLPQPVPVPGEHFYIGVRLVGDGYLEGRNYSVTSSIDSTLRGRTEGYIKAAIFGAPDWRPASDVWYGGPTPTENFEFAFRVWAVPEPASLGLLLAGSVLLVRRR